MEICLIQEALAFLLIIIMGRKYIPITNISLVQQKIRLEQLFPELIEKCEIKRSELLCIMRLQPAEDTAVYRVLIKFKPTDARPKAWMLSPELKLFNGKKPHHIYGLDEKGCPELCVFYPGYSHILDDDRKANAELFENAFYSGKVTATEVEEAEPEEPVAEAAVPAGVDPELLMKLLANPEMAALLKTLAQTIK